MAAIVTTTIFPPFLDNAARLDAALVTHGYAVLNPQGFAAASGCGLQACQALAPFWNDLPPDQHLKDSGHYRRRRHSCFRVEGDQVAQVPHRAHWQPVEYNALHGGMQRWFEPIQPAMVASQVWQQLLLWLADVASYRSGGQAWFVEAHQFRIDTTEGIGRPTPEGAHRDGVDFVAVFLVGRHGIKGGETRVFDANGPAGQRFTLTEPWSLLLLEDARVIHESTPIQPVPGGAEEGPGYRDTLVITLRRGGFQGA
jgi:hypothetical protein